MKKLALAVALAATVASPAFAAPVAYNGIAVTNGITIVPGIGSVTAWYVDNAAGPATNTATPAVNLTVNSDWTFDFANLSNVQFTGSIVLGDYRVQQKITSPVAMQGRQSFTGVTQTILQNGAATYNAGTHTLSYVFNNTTSDGAGASVESHTGTSCTSQGSAFGSTVCSSFSTTPGALGWEGVNLSLVFSDDFSSYTGTLTATNKSGASLTAATTTYKFNLSGSVPTPPPAVPVPAAAWLFGSGLLGLAGVARRRAK